MSRHMNPPIDAGILAIIALKLPARGHCRVKGGAASGARRVRFPARCRLSMAGLWCWQSSAHGTPQQRQGRGYY